MGGATVPSPGGSTGNLVFPSQAEPNPIPFGLRGQGPEQFVTPTTAASAPATPASPSTPPAAATPGYGIYSMGGDEYELLNQGNIYELGYGGQGLSAQNDAFLSSLGYDPSNLSAPGVQPTFSSYGGGPFNYTSNPQLLGSNFAQIGSYDPNGSGVASILSGGAAPVYNPYSLYNQQQVNTFNQSGTFAPFAGNYASLPSNSNNLNLGQTGTNVYGINQNLTQSGPNFLPQV